MRPEQGYHPVYMAEAKDEQGNAFVKFIRDLPNWLHGRATTAPPEVTMSVGQDGEDRRRMKGEVVCLHYGTIDDAGCVVLRGV